VDRFRGDIPAANYAIGVYMAEAGHNLAATYVIAQGYAMGHSSNWYKYWSRGRPWIKSGWEDAHAGYWTAVARGQKRAIILLSFCKMHDPHGDAIFKIKDRNAMLG
jgi:hypothetical protein